MDQNLMRQFEAFGCQNRKDAVITVQVFLELCEVKRYWDIEYKINENTKKLYLTARQNRSSTPSVFIPIETSVNLTFKQLQDYLQFASDSDNQKVFLVFVNADSTCVYYQIMDGLCLPEDISAKHLKQNKTEKLDMEIRRNSELIKQAAMYSMPITLPKKEEPSSN